MLHRNLPVSLLAFGFVLLAVALEARAQAQSVWVDWSDETSTRISGDPSVTTADPEEKDIDVADLDNDGDMDAVVARKTPFSNPGGRTDVLLMNENGVLVDRTSTLLADFLTPDDSRDILAQDLDGDGWADIVIANTFTESPRLFRNQGRDGGGNFLGWTEANGWFSPAFPTGPMFCAVSAGDVDGDGDPDLFFSDYNNSLEDRLLINDGTATFTDETDLRLAEGMKTSAFGTGNIIADFNGDGWGDIVKITTLFAPKALRLLVNDGTGSFAVTQNLPFDEVYMIDAADFDRDGRLDIYVESDNQDYMLLNDATNPNGTIQVRTVTVTSSSKTAAFGGNVHCGDLNRDGYPDVGVADVDVDIPGCSRRFAALRNLRPSTGADGLTDPNDPVTLPWNTQGNHDFRWLDIDQDGFLDVLQGTCSGLRFFRMVPFAATSAYGQGCGGASSPPAIGAAGVPSIGNASFAVTLSNAPPGVVPVLMVSLQKGSVPLGGCTLLVGPPLLVSGPGPVTDASGASQVPLPIPQNPAAEGVRLFWQWSVPDPNGPIGGQISLTGGLDLYVSANIVP